MCVLAFSNFNVEYSIFKKLTKGGLIEVFIILCDFDFVSVSLEELLNLYSIKSFNVKNSPVVGALRQQGIWHE